MNIPCVHHVSELGMIDFIFIFCFHFLFYFLFILGLGFSMMSWLMLLQNQSYDMSHKSQVTVTKSCGHNGIR